MSAVLVRFAREFGWLQVEDPFTGEIHEVRSDDAPKWMVRAAMDRKKAARLAREGRAAA